MLNPRRAAFQDLHKIGCFVIPNPWDVGTARYLRHLGFKALATTSAGYAFACGVPDGAVGLNKMLEHIAEIVAATDLPVNADFGSGFADEPELVARNVESCVLTGVAGLSIEDSTGDHAKPLYEISFAVDRISAAKGAIRKSETGVLLTARAECYLVGHKDPFAESVRRLQAYSDTGADVLYAPGVTKIEEIRAIVSALAPKPVNVLMSADIDLRVSDLEEIGVRRISVGSSLARKAWAGFIVAATKIAEQGSFGGLGPLTPSAHLEKIFDLPSAKGADAGRESTQELS